MNERCQESIRGVSESDNIADMILGVTVVTFTLLFFSKKVHKKESLVMSQCKVIQPLMAVISRSKYSQVNVPIKSPVT